MTTAELQARANARAHEMHIHVMTIAGRPGHYRVSSISEPGVKHYLVACDGMVACDCRGYFYRKSCCHSSALENRLARERVAAERQIRSAQEVA